MVITRGPFARYLNLLRPQKYLPIMMSQSDGLFMLLRVWKGLVLAAFFNLQSRLYYELLGNFMGKGDKETFALGLSVAGLPYHVIATPVGSVGFNQYPFGYAQSTYSQLTADALHAIVG